MNIGLRKKLDQMGKLKDCKKMGSGHKVSTIIHTGRSVASTN
jgi:hypothetical protein